MGSPFPLRGCWTATTVVTRSTSPSGRTRRVATGRARWTRVSARRPPGLLRRASGSGSRRCQRTLFPRPWRETWGRGRRWWPRKMEGTTETARSSRASVCCPVAGQGHQCAVAGFRSGPAARTWATLFQLPHTRSRMSYRIPREILPHNFGLDRVTSEN